MIYLRPIKEDDLDGLFDLVSHASLGLTTLPKDKKILESKIAISLSSFKKEVLEPGDEQYLFVLVEPKSKKIIGVSAVQALTGGADPLYFYVREFIQNDSHLSNVVNNIPILTPVSYVRGPSELCSLYLHQDFRKHGVGKLLSKARFHFIARFTERFTNSITAELRGFIENNKSPFWEAVGRRFFDVKFEAAMEFLKKGRSFIKEFLPKYPIYIHLLPEEVQRIIGQTHPHTTAALFMLAQEGFEITNEVDIFDAGPKLKAAKKDIITIKESVKLKIAEIVDLPTETKSYLISNEKLDFRATIGTCVIKQNNQVSITKEARDALQVGRGDQVRISQFRE